MKLAYLTADNEETYAENGEDEVRDLETLGNNPETGQPGQFRYRRDRGGVLIQRSNSTRRVTPTEWAQILAEIGDDESFPALQVGDGNFKAFLQNIDPALAVWSTYIAAILAHEGSVESAETENAAIALSSDLA